MLVAGDALEATISVSNHSLLPSLGCGLRLSLEQMGADDLVVESPVLLPRRSWNGVRTSNAVWRGVYDLEPPVFAISDPLGVARVRRVGSDRLRVVVVPVSYTHLDVYKRQGPGTGRLPKRPRAPGRTLLPGSRPPSVTGRTRPGLLGKPICPVNHLSLIHI